MWGFDWLAHGFSQRAYLISKVIILGLFVYALASLIFGVRFKDFVSAVKPKP
jgi:hypothetical protein